MATLTSVNSLKVAVALAERQVQRDQSQVSEDSARLDQSQAQLVRDQHELNSVQEQSRNAQTPAATGSRLSKAIASLPAAEAPPKPQVNAQGQTIGKLINIVA